MKDSPPAEPNEVTRLLEQIMAGDDPLTLLQDEIARLHDSFQLETAADVFEAVMFKVSPKRYWIYYRMCDIYTRLGRDDAAFLCANIAIGLEPAAPSWHLYLAIYKYFRHKGRDNEAVDAYLRQIERTPENPIVPLAEVRPLLFRCGHPLAAAAIAPDAETVHHLEEASFITPVSGSFYGISYPLTLRPYRTPYSRPPVDVAEIFDAEALIYNNNVVICSSNGQLFEDLSVSELPGVIAHYARSRVTDADQLEVDAAVVIIDRFPAPNLCHFLLDQITRLELYGRLGVRPGDAAVIGPPATAPYQQAILNQFGVVNYLAATGPRVVKARRLLVSKTCRATHLHPAHGGAPWALNYIRDAFGIVSSKRQNRIYISRADAIGRNIVNETEVVSRLRQAGFIEIVASKLPFSGQVELFRYASHVVAMHGAGLTNIVFCPPGAHVLEFFHPLYGSWAYGVIGAALGLDYRPFVANDGLSKDPIYNDPDQPDFSPLGFAGRGAAVNRDIRVDLTLLEAWLSEVA